VLLKNSLSAPRLQFTLRVAPCTDHSLLVKYYDLLRKATSSVCNIDMSDDQWQQASLPVRSGGFGIRRVSSLAPSAFWASAADTSELLARILMKSGTSYDPACDQTKQQWIAKSNKACPTDTRQRALDKVMVDVEYRALLSRQTELFHGLDFSQPLLSTAVSG
jgi:hypothetical protein